MLNDNNSVVNGTTSSDYVVYTNAKIETGSATSRQDTAEDVAKKVHALEYEYYPKVIGGLLSEVC